MAVGARGIGDDFPDSRMIQTPREDESGLKPVPANEDAGEAHAHLKRDACLARHNSHRPAALEEADQAIEVRWRRVAGTASPSSASARWSRCWARCAWRGPRSRTCRSGRPIWNKFLSG